MGFEPRPPEDSYGRCGSDKIRQTVEDALSACTVVKEPHTSAKEVEVDWYSSVEDTPAVGVV